MTESAIKYDYTKDPSFKDFLLSEASSRQQIMQVCDTFDINYDSMVLSEGAVILESIKGGDRTRVYMPVNNLVNVEYYNLF